MSDDSAARVTLDSAAPNLTENVLKARRQLGDLAGMGNSAPDKRSAHYSLVRRFKGDLDLLIILNTKRCRYRCSFCNLPAKSSHVFISDQDVIAQVSAVIDRFAVCLHALDRVTISNEGSVLDEDTLGPDALIQIAASFCSVPGLSRLVLETRPEFVTTERLARLRKAAGQKIIDALIGFETADDRLRNRTLGKGQPREALQRCLDVLAAFPKTAVTSYVLVKADPVATDAGAVAEAQATVEYLIEQTRQRGLPLTIRLNPMYIADGTRWSQLAQDAQYEPPRLQDIVGLARFTESQGVPAYIGLSTEGLADSANSFRGRADFDRGVLKDAIRISLKPTGGAD